MQGSRPVTSTPRARQRLVRQMPPLLSQVRAIFAGQPREYARDVVQTALHNIGLAGRKALEVGIKRSRSVPNPDGQMRETSFFFDGFDYSSVESAIQRLIKRVGDYEKSIGFDRIDPIAFVSSGLKQLTAPAE